METVTDDWCDTLLRTVWERAGAAGAAAAGADPALRAEIARHETEVGAWLQGQGLVVSRSSIAGYAAVVLAAAQRCGRLLPAEPHCVDWAAPEWYLVRLVALCRMAGVDT